MFVIYWIPAQQWLTWELSLHLGVWLLTWYQCITSSGEPSSGSEPSNVNINHSLQKLLLNGRGQTPQTAAAYEVALKDRRQRRWKKVSWHLHGWGKKNQKTIHWEWQMAREWIDVPFTPNVSFCYMFINQIYAEFKESRWFKICCAERWNSPLIILQKEKVVINRHIQIGSEYYIL